MSTPQPSHSIEAEQSVLGGLLLDNQAWERVADILAESNFYRDDHRRIYRHIGKLIVNGEPADLLTVGESLKTGEVLDKAGGVAYLAALAQNTPSAHNIQSYAEIVRDHAQRRELAAIGMMIHDQASAPGADLLALRRNVEKRLSEIVPAVSNDRVVVVNLLSFVNSEIRPRERILAPWLLTQSLNMLYAWRGVGKTHVALGIAYATASGGTFLKWNATKPRRVLFLDGEMPAASMQERLKGLVASGSEDFDPEYFRLVTPDLQTGAMPDLATAEGQERIDAIIGDTELIVIDNLSSLARSGGRENDAESWLPIQPWALRQRQQGRSVLFVHHSGKGGAQRGTSKREDILDTVLTLKRPAEYSPTDGAAFELHFEKARDMHGDDAQPFEARLQTDQHGVSAWSFSAVEDCTFNRVVSLANEGLSQKDIAEELGINKSNVSRHIRKATETGLIQKGAGHA